MLRLIRFLITGSWHVHKWKITASTGEYCSNSDKLMRYHLQCTKCGAVKKREMK